MANHVELDQAAAMALLHYDRETGLLVWRGGPRAGREAGTINAVHGYRTIGICGYVIMAHRLAWLYMTGEWPKHDIDHINHVKTDNRWGNLRAVSHHENSKNKGRCKRNTSGTCGVSWEETHRSWKAQIGHKMRKIYIGRYKEKWDAICARKSTEQALGFHPNHGGVTSPQ